MGVRILTTGFTATDLKPRVLKNASWGALWALGEQVIEDTEEFVPMSSGRDRGTLRKSAKSVPDEAANQVQVQYERVITYSDADGIEHTVEDGAEKVYEGKNPVTLRPIAHYTTLGTGPAWFDVSMEKNWDVWKRKFTANFINNLVKET